MAQASFDRPPDITVTTAETEIIRANCSDIYDKAFFIVNKGSVNCDIKVYGSASGIDPTQHVNGKPNGRYYTAAEFALEWHEEVTARTTIAAGANEVIILQTRPYNFLAVTAQTTSGETTTNTWFMGRTGNT